MAAKNNSMTREKFEAIHAMKSGGMSADKISKAVDMSVTSVYQALKFDNYEENRKWVYEYYKSRDSKKKPRSEHINENTENDMTDEGAVMSTALVTGITFRFLRISEEFFKLACLMDPEQAAQWRDWFSGASINIDGKPIEDFKK